MGKTKKKTGNPDRLKKVKETSTFKPHSKKKAKLPKAGRSISGSALENISEIQENYSLKKKKKSAKLLLKRKKQESKALKNNETRGKSAFNVLKGNDPTCKANESVEKFNETANTKCSEKKLKPVVNGEQTNVKQKKSAGNNSTGWADKSDKTSVIGNTAVAGKRQQKTKPTLKKNKKKGNKAKCKTSQTASNEVVASKGKKRKTDQDKTDGLQEKKLKEEEIERKSAEPANKELQPSVPSQSDSQSTVPKHEEVIDLISSESEMSDSDFSIVDLTLDDTESEAVNFEPDVSQGEQPETEFVGALSQQEDASGFPSSQSVRSVNISGKKDSKKSRKEKDPLRLHALASFDGQVLLVLQNPGIYCFLGRCFLKCIHGQAEILGFQLTDQFQAFYSPACNSLLTVTTQGKEFSDSESEAGVEDVADTSQKKTNSSEKAVEDLSEQETVRKIYTQCLLLSSDMEKLPKENITILMVRKMDSNVFDYISTFKAFTKLWDNPVSIKSRTEEKTPIELKLDSVGMTYISPQTNISKQSVSKQQLRIVQKWEDILSSDKEPIIMVVGGKNSGKSTLNRYLINYTLNKIPEVCFLECDIGQTEFTPPGCISLQVVSSPVLGPPFTHQKVPKVCHYFGGLTATDSPNLYIECIRKCLQEYRNMEQRHHCKLPLVVNTMGWIEDLGLELLISIIRMTLPSVLVQINFRNIKMNAEPLTPEFVNYQPGWLGHSRFYRSRDCRGLQGNSEHCLLALDSPANNTRRRDQLKPFELRDLAVISYMSSVLSKDSSLSLETPYGVPWNNIAINLCRKGVPKQEWIAAINATIVGLAHADLSEARKEGEDEPYFFDTTPVCPCIGFGMVRAIDTERKVIYITTPLSLVDLVYVNTLIRGSSNIPQQIFTEQITREVREIPYVSRITSTWASKNPRQRKHIPAKSRKRATEANTTE